MKVIDASALAMFINKEPAWEKVERILIDDLCIAPPLIIDEVLNTIWKRAYRKLINAADAKKLAEAFIQNVPVRVITLSTAVWKKAFDIATRKSITIYDAEYIALADWMKIPLVTADKKQGKAAREESVTVIMIA